MRVLAFIGLLIIFMGGVVVFTVLAREGVQGVKNLFRKRAKRTGLWAWDEDTLEDENAVVVFLIEPGTCKTLWVGEPISFSAEDFDFQLELRRSEAQQRLITLNSDRKRIS